MGGGGGGDFAVGGEAPVARGGGEVGLVLAGVVEGWDVVRWVVRVEGGGGGGCCGGEVDC